MSLSHNWLTPTLDVMHLNASFSQALRPGASPLLQFPGVTEEDVMENKGKGIAELIARLEARHDQRAPSIRKATERWGKLDIVDAKFKGRSSAIPRPDPLIFLTRLQLLVNASSPLAHLSTSSSRRGCPHLWTISPNQLQSPNLTKQILGQKTRRRLLSCSGRKTVVI